MRPLKDYAESTAFLRIFPGRHSRPISKTLVLEGSGERLIVDQSIGAGKPLGQGRIFPGFKSAIIERVSRSGGGGERLHEYVIEAVCPACDGLRWSRQARALRVGELGLEELSKTTFSDYHRFVTAKGALRKFAKGRHVGGLLFFAQAFSRVGLGHLSASRSMTSLSEGESRRLRLACLLSMGSSGLVMLLDEPSRGLHEQDLAGLIGSLRRLKTAHSVIVTDHRRMLANAADSVLILGPGAGDAGGSVVYDGASSPHAWQMPGMAYRRKKHSVKTTGGMIRIEGASIHNVVDADCTIPLGMLTCVTGVSGSGKSSFVRGALAPALAALAVTRPMDIAEFVFPQGSWRSAQVDGVVAGLLALDQKTPPPNRRSLVLTALDLAEPLRAHFARTASARTLGLTDTDFG